jgi:hypothetical protein
VAGDAMSPNDTFLLGLRKDVHRPAIACRPVPFRDAVNEDDVDIVDAKLSPEAIDVGTNAGRIASVRLGKNSDPIARNLLEGCGNIGMAAIRVGGVELPPKPTVPVPMARRLVRMPVRPRTTSS